MGGAQRGFTKLEVVILVATVGAMLLVLMPVLSGKRHATRCMTKCSSNLRQLGMAAIQYGDDKRFLPHVNRITELDGDVDTNHTPKIVRTLLWYGYHDNPEGWVCPASDEDAFRPGRYQELGGEMRPWFWAGERIQPTGDESPLADGAPDPTLRETRELSYGWSRRGMTACALSTRILAADKRSAYHDGWNVLKVDGAVELVKRREGKPDWLRKTGRDGGYLAIFPER